MTAMGKEVWTDIIEGLVALTIPLAVYIGWLDLKEWVRRKNVLMLARALTRFGWALTVGAIGIRAIRHYPPIEHGSLWLAAMFVLGLALSCAGFLGIARNYHGESATGVKVHRRAEEERKEGS